MTEAIVERVRELIGAAKALAELELKRMVEPETGATAAYCLRCMRGGRSAEQIDHAGSCAAGQVFRALEALSAPRCIPPLVPVAPLERHVEYFAEDGH